MEFNIWFFILPYAAAAVYFLLRKGALENLIEASKKRRSEKAERTAALAAAGVTGAAAAAAAQGGKPATPPKPKVTTEKTDAGGAFRPGFRDVRWGDAPTGDMTVLKTDGDETLYMRSSDTMKLGEGRLSGINYQFWRGRCAGVFLQIAPGSLDRVIEALTAQYGKPAVPKDGRPKFYWLSLGSGEQATQAMVDGDPERKAGTVVIFSKTMADERKAAAAAAAAAAPQPAGGSGAIALGPVDDPGTPTSS